MIAIDNLSFSGVTTLFGPDSDLAIKIIKNKITNFVEFNWFDASWWRLYSLGASTQYLESALEQLKINDLLWVKFKQHLELSMGDKYNKIFTAKCGELSHSDMQFVSMSALIFNWQLSKKDNIIINCPECGIDDNQFPNLVKSIIDLSMTKNIILSTKSRSISSKMLEEGKALYYVNNDELSQLLLPSDLNKY